MGRRDDSDDVKMVSLNPKDAIEAGGFFGPGRAKINKFRFEEFTYKKKGGGKTVTAPVLMAYFERDGEETAEPYTVGSGWKIGPKGAGLIPRNGQAGLPNNSNAFYLLDSLVEKGMPEDYLDKLATAGMDGTIEVMLISKPINRDFNEGSDRDSKDGDAPKKAGRSKLVVDEVLEAPWMDGGKSSSRSKGKSKDADDDEPPAKKRAKSDEDDEPKSRRSSKDDDDEKPAKGKAGKSSKAKDEEDTDEQAVEAMAKVLEDGPVKIDDLEDDVRKILKGNPEAKVIAARCSEDDFLEMEKGWTVDRKKGRIIAD